MDNRKIFYANKQNEILRKQEIAEYKRQYNQQWAKANPDKVRAAQKKYTETHKEKLREWHKQYYLEHKEELREYQKQYYLEKKEKIAAQKKYRQEHNDSKNELVQLKREIEEDFFGKNTEIMLLKEQASLDAAMLFMNKNKPKKQALAPVENNNHQILTNAQPSQPQSAAIPFVQQAASLPFSQSYALLFSSPIPVNNEQVIDQTNNRIENCNNSKSK